MKFFDDKTYEDEIIESVVEHSGCFQVTFLDDDNNYYFSKNSFSIEDLRKKMIEQAVIRDEELYNKYKSLFLRNIFAFNLSILELIFVTKGNVQFSLCILFIFGLLYFSRLMIKDGIKYYDLKKYRIFLEIKEDLKKEEHKNILDCIEFERIYQDPRGVVIDNLDNYSYFDIKTIKKEIKRQSN